MLKREFEELAKIEVSEEDYSSIIEPMYMATGLTKEEFVKALNLKYFELKSKDELIKELKALVVKYNANYNNPRGLEILNRVIRISRQLFEKYDVWVRFAYSNLDVNHNYHIKELIIDNELTIY